MKRKAKIADRAVQDLYREMSEDISSKRLGEVLDEIEKLPYLNKRAVKIKNRKGVMIAYIGRKGSYKEHKADYCNGCWYFDGNRLGKKKKMLIAAFYDENILDDINVDYSEVTKIWKRIEDRV